MEVYKGRMIAPISPREDDKVPQFSRGVTAVDITDESPKPQPGWLWDGAIWTPSILPTPAKLPSLLEQMDAKLDAILQRLTPGSL